MKIVEYQQKIVLIIGAILICGISFYAGKLYSAGNQKIEIEEKDKQPKEILELLLSSVTNESISGKLAGNAILKTGEKTIKIEDDGSFTTENEGTITAQNDIVNFTSTIPKVEKTACQTEEKTEASNSKTNSEEENKTEEKTTGKYIASKKGKKYHLTTSGTAKQIKEENKVYFDSQEEAEKAGYEAGTSVK